MNIENRKYKVKSLVGKKAELWVANIPERDTQPIKTKIMTPEQHAMEKPINYFGIETIVVRTNQPSDIGEWIMFDKVQAKMLVKELTKFILTDKKD